MKKVNLLEQLRQRAVSFGRNTWFRPAPENVGVEIFGRVKKLFHYERQGMVRWAMEVEVFEDVQYTVDDEMVTVEAGSVVTVGMTGQLKYFVDSQEVKEGDIVYLRYEGRGQQKVHGQYPHVWATAVSRSDVGEEEDKEEEA